MNLTEIYRANQTQLIEFSQQLTIKKMKLDRFFSKFLEQYDLDELDRKGPEWQTYKEMLHEYENTSKLITSTNYALKSYGQHSRFQNSY